MTLSMKVIIGAKFLLSIAAGDRLRFNQKTRQRTNFDFVTGIPALSMETAVQMEKDLAEDLRRAGYTVTGGH